MQSQRLILTEEQRSQLEALELQELPSKEAAAEMFGVKLRQIQEDCQLLRRKLNSRKIKRFVPKGKTGIDGKSLQALFLFRGLVKSNWTRREAAEAVKELIVFTGI